MFLFVSYKDQGSDVSFCKLQRVGIRCFFLWVTKSRDQMFLLVSYKEQGSDVSSCGLQKAGIRCFFL